MSSSVAALYVLKDSSFNDNLSNIPSIKSIEASKLFLNSFFKSGLSFEHARISSIELHFFLTLHLFHYALNLHIVTQDLILT